MLTMGMKKPHTASLGVQIRGRGLRARVTATTRESQLRKSTAVSATNPQSASSAKAPSVMRLHAWRAGHVSARSWKNLKPIVATSAATAQRARTLVAATSSSQPRRALDHSLMVT